MEQILNMQQIIGLMNNKYTLMWADYQDNLDENLKTIKQCLQKQCSDMLHEKVNEWYMDSEQQTIDEIIKQLTAECIKKGFTATEVEAFFEDHEDEIRDEIYARDDSDVLKELLRNTSDIPVRIEMLSNNDCINSHWLESQDGYSYINSYFGDMVDVLNLNPTKVKKILLAHDEKVQGRFPNKKARDSKEIVTYEDFYQELINSCCGANLLTFKARINPSELYEADFNLKEVVIPKGNQCGLFSTMQGGGSLLEMELQREVKFSLVSKGYPGYRLEIDDEDREYFYTIGQVYGCFDTFFGNNLTIIPQTYKSINNG